MPKLSPEEGAAKWSRRLAGATEDIRAGIERVTEAPGMKAAAKRQKWQQELARSGDKWERNVRSVSLEQWRDKAINVGVARVAQGAQANVDKYARVAGELYPHIAAGQRAVASMPDTSIEERINKSVAFMRHMSSFRRSGSGSGGGA